MDLLDRYQNSFHVPVWFTGAACDQSVRFRTHAPNGDIQAEGLASTWVSTYFEPLISRVQRKLWNYLRITQSQLGLDESLAAFKEAYAFALECTSTTQLYQDLAEKSKLDAKDIVRSSVAGTYISYKKLSAYYFLVFYPKHYRNLHGKVLAQFDACSLDLVDQMGLQIISASTFHHSINPLCFLIDKNDFHLIGLLHSERHHLLNLLDFDQITDDLTTLGLL